MNSKGATSGFQGFVVVFFILICILPCVASDQCEQPVGKLVSIQGSAQIQHANTSSWQPIILDALLCPGDMLRTAANSRAAIVLANESVLRIDQKSTITFPQAQEEKLSVLELLRGVLHIFSHRPRSLKVVTPYVNGVVEGTEFLVTVDDEKSVITVFEGMVLAVNQHGQLRLASNQSAVAKKGAAPVYIVVVKPRDAVVWTLYYPAILELPDTTSPLNAADIMIRVGQFLAVGRVEEAEQLIGKIIKDDPQNGEAYALSSIIATVRNNKDKALQLAERAINLNPKSSAAALALSYARQAQFDLPGALEALRQAAESNPNNALVKARLAEILLAVGEIDDSISTAQKAVNLNPNIGLTQTVLGFVYLARVEIDEAFAAFTKAISLDPALPLARLGLGLAKIRKGMVEEGRADIEIAAALDPGSAIIRSYLGKAYFEEKRDRSSQRQYDIAKELDPADPTPWLYDAIRKQSINRPVEALHDIQKSIELNNNRAVYRSRLFLDDDLASRSSGLGRIYTDLGFEQLAQVEGWKSIQADPSNYSAHRLLADIYSALPRYEIARVSELLKSQLLQPINITAVQPQLAESDLRILEGTGPSTLSINEFNPLFLRDRIGLQASGVIGSNSILGNEVIVSGIYDRFSYSIGQFHYETDGIRDNNDQDQDIYNGFFQYMISPKTSILTELRFRDLEFGDTFVNFDADDFDENIRNSEEVKSARLGLRHNFQPNSVILATALIGDAEGRAFDNITELSDPFPPAIDFGLEEDSLMLEILHLYQRPKFNIQTGAGYIKIDASQSIRFITPIFSSLAEDDDKTEHTNLYSYSQLKLPHHFTATLGLSADKLESPVKDREELSPKIGLTWQPVNTTLINFAAFRAINRAFVNSQTIEPTLIAGFNQFFNDLISTISWTYGLSIDQAFSNNLYGGAKFFHRDLEVPFFTASSLGVEPTEDDWEEDIGSAYIYWALCKRISIGLEYYYERFQQEQFEGPKGIFDLKTHRITPKIQYFHPNGLSGDIQASFIDQEGEFVDFFSGTTEDSDSFWILDLTLSYRLPKRYGVLKFEIKNLFDQQFNFQDKDPWHPRFLPEQQIIGSITLSF